ncbi:MAG: hypothetical protein GXP08_16020 [Gammaproteobacteria bacterium]|nr:hypothetical protein [Gammaproteobacteria bacterium]
MLVILPRGFSNARRYIVDVILSEFLGLRFEVIERSDVDGVEIRDSGKILRIVDCFFSQAQHNWLSESSLPKLPLKIWKVSEELPEVNTVYENLPVIYGPASEDDQCLMISGLLIHLKFDIFGSIFFMLTRYEEAVRSEIDCHQRFPASSSVAFQENFIDRPIVNEYIEVLWACMLRLWPSLKRKNHSFKVKPTHDVDRPFALKGKSLGKLLLSFGADVLVRRNPRYALVKATQWLQVRRGRIEVDPYFVFDDMMDLSECYGLKSSFYFLADNTHPIYDGNYLLGSPEITGLLKKIHNRGHKIGLHGSYDSYISFKQLQKEFNFLLEICDQLGIKQNTWGARQHFLRWKTPDTFANLDKVGLDYDTTLSYSDHAGFRCGTCYEYTAFDVRKICKLNIKEKPLIVMECTVLDDRYMGISSQEDALHYVLTLKERCKKYNGNFIFLWHNTRYLDPKEREIIECLMK